jgi:hypothetical protein
MDPLIRLVEKDKVVTTCTLLFNHTDARNWQGVQACFAPEVLFDMTSLTGGDPVTMTPRAIADAWEQGLRPLQAIHHQVGNFIVDVKDRQADVFCYGIAAHYLPNPTGNHTRVFVGSYDFHLSKMSDDWRIDKFKFKLKYIDGNKELTS